MDYKFHIMNLMISCRMDTVKKVYISLQVLCD